MSNAKITGTIRRDGWPGSWSGYLRVKLSDGRKFRGMVTSSRKVIQKHGIP